MTDNFDENHGAQLMYSRQNGPNATSNTGKVLSSSEGIKKVPYRRGKWTSEEEAYANRLIHEFKLGMLPLTDGTTLRTFLSKLLNCDPMRISKKFVGQNCIGKQVFRRRPSELDKLTEEQLEKTRRDLSELERLFLERVAQTNRSQRTSGGVAKAGRGTLSGEGAPPWMIPPEERNDASNSSRVEIMGHLGVHPSDMDSQARGSDLSQGLKHDPSVQSAVRAHGREPSSTVEGAAMRQSHHPNISIDAGGSNGIYNTSAQRRGDEGDGEDLKAYYDTSMMNASLQSSYHESSESPRSKLHQGEPVVHSLPLAWTGPGAGVRLSDNDTATAAAAAAAAASMPNIQIPIASDRSEMETRSRPKRAAHASRRIAEPLAPVGSAVKKGGTETRSGGIKRVNSLELFNFSFDDPLSQGVATAPLNSQDQQEQDNFDLLA